MIVGDFFEHDAERSSRLDLQLGFPFMLRPKSLEHVS